MTDKPEDFTQRGGVFLACLAIVALSLVYSCVRAGGTVTDSKYYLLQRSGVNQTPNPASMTECLARMLERIEQELKSRTTGYVTYKCLDISQSYVKFSKTAPAPPVVTPVPPTASLQVYACADAGADGRILESATIAWPNCATDSYQNPSRSLVVATNDDGVLRWRSAANVTTGRVGTQTGTAWAWIPVGDINWGTTTPPIVTLSAPLTWTLPTQNVNGTALTNLAGFRIYYGATPAALVATVEINNPAVLAYEVKNLTAGTWHFAIKSLTPTQESAMSNTVTVTLP